MTTVIAATTTTITDPAPAKTFLGPNSKVIILSRRPENPKFKNVVLQTIAKFQKESPPITSFSADALVFLSDAIVHDVNVAMGGGTWVCSITPKTADGITSYIIGQLLFLTVGELYVRIMGTESKTEIISSIIFTAPMTKRKKTS